MRADYHSNRKAIMGSTFEARRAGNQHGVAGTLHQSLYHESQIPHHCHNEAQIHHCRTPVGSQLLPVRIGIFT